MYILWFFAILSIILSIDQQAEWTSGPILVFTGASKLYVFIYRFLKYKNLSTGSDSIDLKGSRNIQGFAQIRIFLLLHLMLKVLVSINFNWTQLVKKSDLCFIS